MGGPPCVQNYRDLIAPNQVGNLQACEVQLLNGPRPLAGRCHQQASISGA